jgi:hypothetical protein
MDGRRAADERQERVRLRYPLFRKLTPFGIPHKNYDADHLNTEEITRWILDGCIKGSQK